MKYLTPAQVNRIHGLLKLQGHNTVTLAQAIGHPWSTVAGVCNGRKRTPAVRTKVAQFLGRPEAELFPENGNQALAPPCGAGAAVND